MDYAGGGAAVIAPTCFAVAVLTHVSFRSTMAALAYFALAFAGCLFMPMAAAPMAMALGGIAFITGYFFRRLTFAVIFGGFALYLVTSPLIALSQWPAKLMPGPPGAASSLGEQDVISRQARLGIWHHVARLVAEKPVIGHGFGAARDLSARNERLPNIDLAAIPIHPHNGVLQVWLELGAVGVVIVGGLLFCAWRATRMLWHRPLAAATVAGTLVAAAVPILVSFSLWNTWWLAALGFAAVFTVRAVAAVPETM
jgi:O-antigen ligase